MKTRTRKNAAPHVSRIRAKGMKGGVSALQRVTDGVEKTTRRIGLKGGAAVLAGGAAGIALGAALGSLAGAAMTNAAKGKTLDKRMADIAHNAEDTAEEITKRAENLKEAVKKIKAN